MNHLEDTGHADRLAATAPYADLPQLLDDGVEREPSRAHVPDDDRHATLYFAPDEPLAIFGELHSPRDRAEPLPLSASFGLDCAEMGRKERFLELLENRHLFLDRSISCSDVRRAIENEHSSLVAFDKTFDDRSNGDFAEKLRRRNNEMVGVTCLDGSYRLKKCGSLVRRRVQRIVTEPLHDVDVRGMSPSLDGGMFTNRVTFKGNRCRRAGSRHVRRQVYDEKPRRVSY
jgi:hypothetical protein